MQKDKTVLRTVAEGVIVGLVATQALDWISTYLYEKETEAERIRENEARGNLFPYEVAMDNLARKVGTPLPKKDVQKWGWRFHKSFGWFGGVQYMMMRRANPKVGAGLGLGFGTGFFLIVDELLMPLFKWSPGPQAFSWKVHARGAAAHIGYGVAAETTARALDLISGRKAA